MKDDRTEHVKSDVQQFGDSFYNFISNTKKENQTFH